MNPGNFFMRMCRRPVVLVSACACLWLSPAAPALAWFNRAGVRLAALQDADLAMPDRQTRLDAWTDGNPAALPFLLDMNQWNQGISWSRAEFDGIGSEVRVGLRPQGRWQGIALQPAPDLVLQLHLEGDGHLVSAVGEDGARSGERWAGEGGAALAWSPASWCGLGVQGWVQPADGSGLPDEVAVSGQWRLGAVVRRPASFGSWSVGVQAARSLGDPLPLGLAAQHGRLDPAFAEHATWPLPDGWCGQAALQVDQLLSVVLQCRYASDPPNALLWERSGESIRSVMVAEPRGLTWSPLVEARVPLSRAVELTAGAAYASRALPGVHAWGWFPDTGGHWPDTPLWGAGLGVRIGGEWMVGGQFEQAEVSGETWWRCRGGIEYWFLPVLSLRGGYGQDQPGGEAVRHRASLGVGLQLPTGFLLDLWAGAESSPALRVVQAAAEARFPL